MGGAKKMDPNKLTLKAQEALQEAKSIAEKKASPANRGGAPFVCLLAQKDGVVIPILQKLGANPDLIHSQLENELNRIPQVTGRGAGQVYLSSRANEILNMAWKEAEALTDEYLSTEHLLIAIADEKQGGSYQILQRSGVTKDAIFRVLQEIRGSQRVTDQNPEDKYQALKTLQPGPYGRGEKGKARPGDRER